MRGIKPSDIPVLVARDIEIIRKEARIVLTISGDKVVQFFNPEGLLWVIAIIGPGYLGDIFFREALLAEIGMRETRPYHEAKIYISGKRIRLHKRNKLFMMSEEQHLLVAPQIFSLLQKLTDERVKKRKFGSDNPFFIKTPNNFYFSKKRAFETGTSSKPKRRGLRFSVNLEDQYFLQDVFWAERNLSLQLKDQLRGMANIINKGLTPYQGSKKPFIRLKVVEEISRMISRSRLQKHLLIEMLERYLPKGQENPFWADIASGLLQWDGKETEEKRLSSSILPEPEGRTGRIQLRVTISLDGVDVYGKPHRRISKREKDYIVFEVFATGDERYPQRTKTILSQGSRNGHQNTRM